MAGLCQPREPREPWISTKPCEPYVVIEDELEVLKVLT